jgi:hypothetical protein
MAEYREWPFQGFLKRTRIGNETTYNLEFQLPCILEHLHLPISADVLGNESNEATVVAVATPPDTVAHSKVQLGTPRARRTRISWTVEENGKILKMKGEGCSWEEIHRALPRRTLGAIQVQYSLKLKKWHSRRGNS